VFQNAYRRVRHPLPIKDHRRNLPRIRNILQGIAIEEQQIRMVPELRA
jgi:hypothetical protein